MAKRNTKKAKAQLTISGLRIEGADRESLRLGIGFSSDLLKKLASAIRPVKSRKKARPA